MHNFIILFIIFPLYFFLFFRMVMWEITRCSARFNFSDFGRQFACGTSVVTHCELFGDSWILFGNLDRLLLVHCERRWFFRGFFVFLPISMSVNMGEWGCILTLMIYASFFFIKIFLFFCVLHFLFSDDFDACAVPLVFVSFRVRKFDC